MCFEFQDVYHYWTTWYANDPLKSIHVKDGTKQNLLLRRGITLILVPFWWDGTHHSLLATIGYQRPDLIQINNNNNDIHPISLNPPDHIPTGIIPGVGELMLASFPSSNTVISDTWWLGEKYDGIRFCWNPQNSTLNGGPLMIHERMYDHLMDSYFEGELWIGRGGYSESQSIYNEGHMVNWSLMRAIVFDSPHPLSLFRSLPFESRYQLLLHSISITHPFLVPGFRLMCGSQKELIKMGKSIMEDEGEGVILRFPKSLYESGRSSNLVKWKAMRMDDEALVVYIKIDGSLAVLQTPDGNTFEVEDVVGPVHEGDVVTYSYDKHSQKDVPFNPSILRVRSDLSWPQILHDFQQKSKLASRDKNVPENTVDYIVMAQNQRRDRAKLVFDLFAKKNNFDSTLPDNWYNMYEEFSRFKGAKALLFQYKWNYVAGLLDVFPNIGFDKSKFNVESSLPRRYWDDVDRRRDFFYSFAKNNNFDPLNPNNWYALHHNAFLHYKSARPILQHHNGRFSTALVHLFPEIGLNESKLPKFRYKMSNFQVMYVPDPDKKYKPLERKKSTNKSPHNKFRDVAARRTFFIDYARSKGFDPFTTENWHPSLINHDLSLKKGAGALLHYYRGSFISALIKLFPELNAANLRALAKRSHRSKI